MRIGDTLDPEVASRFTLAEAEVELKALTAKIEQIRAQIKVLHEDSQKRISHHDLDVVLTRLGKTFPQKQLEVRDL